MADIEVVHGVPEILGHELSCPDPVGVRGRHDDHRLALAEPFVVQLHDLGVVALALEKAQYPLPDAVWRRVEIVTPSAPWKMPTDVVSTPGAGYACRTGRQW